MKVFIGSVSPNNNGVVQQPVVNVMLSGQHVSGALAIQNQYVYGRVEAHNLWGYGFNRCGIHVQNGGSGWEIYQGQERYGLRPMLRHTHGAFIIFSVFDRPSFELAERALTIIRRDSPHPIVTVLIGHRFTTVTSTPPIREITDEEPLLLAKSYDIDYMEVDAITGIGIDKMFTKMLSTILVDWKELIVQLKLTLLCGTHKRAGRGSPMNSVPQPLLKELISSIPWQQLITDNRLHKWIQNFKPKQQQNPPPQQTGGCLVC
ncbi:hypothetical protein Pelo_9319 [Pelomyxa schiedti]|nr:hypothetical protein Pelo_9319 [Pelomyxa schiedti]